MVTSSRKTGNGHAARRVGRLVAVAMLLILSATAPPAVRAADATWIDRYRAALTAYRSGDFAGARTGMLRVAQEIGETPGLEYNLACAEARLGHRDEALRRLKLFARSGLVRDAAADSDLVSLWKDRAFLSVAAAIRANADSIGAAAELRRFSDPDLLTEDLAFDPNSGASYVTSVHRGVVVEVTRDGIERMWADSDEPHGWGVFAARLDPARGLLWTSVAATPTASGYMAADSGRTGVVAWDIRSRAIVRRIEWPRDGRPHVLGDLTVAPDGTVYVTDSRSGAVRMVQPGARTLSNLLPDGTFRSPQTPALDASGKRLYVPEYGRGIAIVELVSGRIAWLTFEPGLCLQGIDGLYTAGRDLIAVQNGITPRRIVRIRLDRDGTHAASVTPLESGTHRLGEPSHGVVVGSEFRFLANTGWDRVGDDESFHEGGTPAAIYAVAISDKHTRGIRPRNTSAERSPDPAPPVRRAAANEHFFGQVRRGERYEHRLSNGIRFVLQPEDEGWRVAMYGADTTQNLVGIATPPYHGVNEADIQAWHFRNKGNTGPNQGDVNAPQKERGFYFLENPSDYPAFAEALDRALHAPQPNGDDNADSIMASKLQGEGMLRIQDLKLGGLVVGTDPYIESMSFEVTLKHATAPRPAWQPGPGHSQVPLWPNGVPQRTRTADRETTIPGGSLVAGRPWQAIRYVSRPTVTLYPPKGRNTGAAVIVFPGGGYQILAIDLEGAEVCDWLTSRGITCALLKYRVPNKGGTWDQECGCDRTTRTSMPLEDAQRAISFVRHHAAAWHIDPHKIGVLGFSAGGHLVAEVSTRFDHRVYAARDAEDQESCRPDFAVAVYPGHLYDYRKSELNPDLHVTKDTPPTFLLHAENDRTDGPSNTLVYYETLKDAGVPVELHMYAEGGHAFGLRPTKFPITRWPNLVETWMHSIGMTN